MPTSASRRGRTGGGRSGATVRRPRRRDPLWARLLVLAGALVMMLSGGALVGGHILISNLNNTLGKENLLGEAGAAAGNQKSLKGPLNILMVGLDERPDNGELPKSDSIIIMHVPATHDQAYLVSIPRDLYVKIPAVKNLHPVSEYNKINAAFAYGAEKNGRAGGMALLATTLKALAGIEFNAGAIVNFGGFQKIVELLGGVDMCLDQAVDSHHIGRDKKTNQLVPRYKYPNAVPVHYSVGCRHLEAWEALDYVRQRYGLPNTDYDRARHQQQFIKAILKRAKDQGLVTNPVKALSVKNAAGEALTVDTNGTDLSTWAFTLRGVANSELTMLKVNSGTFLTRQISADTQAEDLNDESKAMLAALRDDRLAEFIMQHPGVIAQDTL